MEVDPSRVATAPLVPFAGEGWRHLSPRHDPLSGEGARMAGGRFNPPSSFPVLYICRTRACTVAELRRFGDRQIIGVEGLLPRYLYRYAIELDRVLDLTDDDVRLLNLRPVRCRAGPVPGGPIETRRTGRRRAAHPPCVSREKLFTHGRTSSLSETPRLASRSS